MTATGYNDYLSRMTTPHRRGARQRHHQERQEVQPGSQFPILQAYRPLLTGWIDTYIRQRLFGQTIRSTRGRELARAADRRCCPRHRWNVRHRAHRARSEPGGRRRRSRLPPALGSQDHHGANQQRVEVDKCIYPKLPIPTRSGGLERLFIEWADQDTRVEAFSKIHEYRHDFLQRPYLKADGMPARYSPDFLVRTEDECTWSRPRRRARSATTTSSASSAQHSLVRADQRAGAEQRETGVALRHPRRGAVQEWKSKNARASELLDFARLRRTEQSAVQESMF